MNKSDFPHYYITASKISSRNQKWFFRVHRWESICLVLLSIYFLLQSSLRIANFELSVNYLSIIPIILSVLILFFMSILHFFDFSKKWSKARTFVESLKKESWNYMMRSGVNCKKKIPQSEIDSKFILTQERLLDITGHYKTEIVNGTVTGSPITQTMIDIQKKTWMNRFNYYKEKRLKDQIDFYSKNCQKKVRFCKFFKCSILFFGLILFFISLACVFLPNNKYISLFIPLLISVIAVVTAQNNLRKYGQIADSYGNFSKQLEKKLNLSKYIDSEIQFIKFIDECENCISIENSSWSILRS